MHRTLLLLDIGSGTQDALLYKPGRELSNCPKFVLPAPARRVGERIRTLTEQGAPIYLHGSNMGGGFFGMLKKHLQAGLPVAAHPEAALALGDDPERLAAMGVTLAESCPSGHAPVRLADYEPAFWEALLTLSGCELPDRVVAAAQDHGYHPHGSNRLGRFELWRHFLNEQEGDPCLLLYTEAPEELTRLRTVAGATGGGPVADSGAAALLGALFDEEVRTASAERGVTVVNLGNSHIVAFLLYKGRVHGVYEHHTGLRSREELLADLKGFAAGSLCNQEVLDSRGHGCEVLDLPSGAGGFSPLYLLGPTRELLGGQGVMLAPGGDMMLAGCFGLLHAMRARGWAL